MRFLGQAALRPRDQIYGGAASAPANPSLPLTGNIIERNVASDLAQAAGSTVTSWAGRYGVATYVTSAGSPTYQTVGGFNSKPFVRFAGGQSLKAGRPAAFLAAYDGASRNYSTMIVYRCTGANANGPIWRCSVGGNSLYLMADGTVAGRFDGGTTVKTYPVATNGFTVLIHVSTNIDNRDGQGTGVDEVWLNGSLVARSQTATPTLDPSAEFTMGGNVSGTVTGKVDIFEIINWNDAFEWAEALQANDWAYWFYGQTLPRETLGKYYGIYGDSLESGVGVTNSQYAVPARVATRGSLPLGTWSNFGIGGIAIDNGLGGGMLPRVTKDFTNVRTQVLSRTPSCRFLYHADEWYNQKPGSSTVNSITAMNNLLAAVLAAGQSASDICIGDSTDAISLTAPQIADRAAYNSYWGNAANRAGKCAAFAQISSDANIGVPGCAAASNTWYGSDGVHLTDTGYQVKETYVGPAVLSL